MSDDSSLPISLDVIQNAIIFNHEKLDYGKKIFVENAYAYGTEGIQNF